MSISHANHTELAISEERDTLNSESRQDSSDINQTLQEIERLLSQEGEVLNDPAFPDTPGLNRRSDQRHPFLAEVMAILPEPQNPEEPTGIFRTVRGWTTDLSPGSVGFVLPEELCVESLLLVINHPDYTYPRCCFSVRIFRHRQRENGDWEYGAVLRPMFDADSVVPTLFGDATRF
jgi:hypothetical protein